MDQPTPNVQMDSTRLNQPLLAPGGVLVTTRLLRSHQSTRPVHLAAIRTQTDTLASLVLLITSVPLRQLTRSSRTTLLTQVQLRPAPQVNMLKRGMDSAWRTRQALMAPISVFLALIQIAINARTVLLGTTALTLLYFRFPVLLALIRTRPPRRTARCVALVQSVSSDLRLTRPVRQGTTVQQAGFQRRYVQLATPPLKALLSVCRVLMANTAPSLAT